MKFVILINVIGIIDSGSGGINVILECMKYYNQDFIYLLDNKNCPYGNKNKIELLEILKTNVDYLINNYNIDLIIIAFKTISAIVDYSFLLKYKIPILKTIPCLKNIKKYGEEILLFATKNTIKNSKQIKLIKKNYPALKTLQIKGLAKLIDNYLEDNLENKNKLIKLLNENFLFKNNVKNKYKNIKYISLGCTHFKHIEKFLSDIFNKSIAFYSCEKNVAYISKWLIRKSKKQSTLNLVLTEQNDKLEDAIYKMFKQNVNSLM